MADLPETVSLRIVPTLDKAALDGYTAAASSLVKSLEDMTNALQFVTIRDRETDAPSDEADEAAPNAAGLYDDAAAETAVADPIARIDALEARLTCVEDALDKANAVSADAVATRPKPRIEKLYHDTGIDAVVAFPCLRRDTSVRVRVWIDALPHKKPGVTDARILAEACKVLATVSAAHPGSDA
jgi:hypothetical protein